MNLGLSGVALVLAVIAWVAPDPSPSRLEARELTVRNGPSSIEITPTTVRLVRGADPDRTPRVRLDVQEVHLGYGESTLSVDPTALVMAHGEGSAHLDAGATRVRQGPTSAGLTVDGWHASRAAFRSDGVDLPLLASLRVRVAPALTLLHAQRWTVRLGWFGLDFPEMKRCGGSALVFRAEGAQSCRQHLPFVPSSD